MGRGYPSMAALLGLLAVVGYQNRDKLAEMFGGRGAPGQGGLGDLLGRLGGGAGGAGAGGMLSGGLGELLDRFRQDGQGEAADSWIAKGPNRAIAPADLEHAIGADTLDDLSKQTGLSPQELVARLSRELPDAVDKYTPEGRLPTEDDFPRA